ncbi:hypothetical protein KFE98_14845 [bacterium SCSIO 12741]|nr:hypothetical protein KFE98_14845 [bacterium SCSIO 12741]
MSRSILLLLFLLPSTLCFGQFKEYNETYLDTIVTQSGEMFIVHLVRIVSESDDHQVQVQFFKSTLSGDRVAHFVVDKDPVRSCDPEVYDYNGDGYPDYSFVSMIAARGSNTVRTLLLFDPEKSTFIHIKNSEDYPNLTYNSVINCIDSWAFHGGTSQYFLHVKSDSLIPFYGIDVYGSERISRKFENGEWIVIKTDSIENTGFPRYLDYRTFDEYGY